MENHHQDVVRRRHLEEGNPYRDFERHVEAARRHVEQRRVEMRIPNLDRIQLHRGPVDRQNQLLRGSVDIRVDRPQGLVSLEKRSITAACRGRTGSTEPGEPDRERKIVGGRRRIETVDEPHALLRKRERDDLGTRLGDQRGELPGVARHRLGAGPPGWRPWWIRRALERRVALPMPNPLASLIVLQPESFHRARRSRHRYRRARHRERRQTRPPRCVRFRCGARGTASHSRTPARATRHDPICHSC